MATTKVLTYDVKEVAKMLGMTDIDAYRLVRKGAFPFPVIQVGEKRWVVPRAAVDKALLNGTGGDLTKEKKAHLGRPKRWHKGGFLNWNMRVPIELAEAFNFVVDQINRGTASPLTYGDARLLAFQEFIERRPVKTK